MGPFCFPGHTENSQTVWYLQLLWCETVATTAACLADVTWWQLSLLVGCLQACRAGLMNLSNLSGGLADPFQLLQLADQTTHAVALTLLDSSLLAICLLLFTTLLSAFTFAGYSGLSWAACCAFWYHDNACGKSCVGNSAG